MTDFFLRLPDSLTSDRSHLPFAKLVPDGLDISHCQQHIAKQRKFLGSRLSNDERREDHCDRPHLHNTG